MKQEDKDLLLKDICGRLPYGVKVYDVKSSINSPFMNLNHVNGIVGEVFISYMNKCRTAPIEDIKPYLFPLSSMTDEQAKELFNIFGLVCPSTEEDYIKINECTGITFFLCQGFDVETHLDKLIDWLNKNHFDYRGLIPMGLANDCTNLNVY